MGRRDDYRRTLRHLDREDWPAYLTKHSNLPGPRANLELANAVADEREPSDFDAMIASDNEFLTFCGVLGLGQLLATSSDPQTRAQLVERLHSHAADERWRVREAVATGLQRVGDSNLPRLVDLVSIWSADPDPLVRRAAVAAICEPRLLADPAAAAAALDTCDRVTASVAALPQPQRRDPAVRTLRQALGYCWSVAVAAAPRNGLARLRQLAASSDPDLAWIVRQNKRKRRLAKLLTGPLLAAVILGACTTAVEPAPRPSLAARSQTASSAASSAASTSPAAAPSPSPPAAFDPQAAYAVVEQLAGGIGPREASGAGFSAAADLVERGLAAFGYQVTRQAFPVPAGTSWGVPVPAGQSQNVLAAPVGFDPAAPHRLVGAHLDTVPQAPGAEDNASGVAVLLELARLAAAVPPSVPVVFVAFGAEEPRGSGDTMHHFGSRHLVANLPAAQRTALAGMLSLDRVGVATQVLSICHGGLAAGAVRSALIRSAATVGVPARACGDNRASDHWSFEKAGLDAARLGSVPYAAYHSPADLPGVVDPAQLQRTAAVAWAWLNSPS